MPAQPITRMAVSHSAAEFLARVGLWELVLLVLLGGLDATLSPQNRCS
jgi:hypothetical protein